MLIVGWDEDWGWKMIRWVMGEGCLWVDFHDIYSSLE